MTDPDEIYGLPLLRARWCLLPTDITQPTLIASLRRSRIQQPTFVPGDPWRYEVFVIPPNVTRETWASWESQEADALIKAEVERQSTWLQGSLALRACMEEGTFEGFGRRNDIAGDWISIPKQAWKNLRVAFDPTFKHWRDGHVTGAGLDLWDVRILDRKGLPLDAASLAYGPAVAAASVQEMRATVIEDEPSQADDRGSASLSVVVRLALLEMLKTGKLLGFGHRGKNDIAAISRREWSAGAACFEKSELKTDRCNYSGVIVRPPHPIAEAADERSHEPTWRNDDAEDWFRDRVERAPAGRWLYSEDDDLAAASAKFPGIVRDAVRGFRKKHLAGRIKSGQRAKVAKPPPKAAAQL